MKSLPDLNAEPQWIVRVEALAQYVDVPTTRQDQTRLESLLDKMYVMAASRGRAALRELDGVLSERATLLPPVRVWIAFTRYRLARRQRDRISALAWLDAELHAASPRTQWIVGVNAAYLVWRRQGLEQAYPRIAFQEPFAGEEHWQYDSPLVVSAVLAAIEMAIVRGDEDKRDRMVAFSKALWSAEHPAQLRVTLRLIEQQIAHGHFESALAALASIRHFVHGEIRMHWAYARLHALVASGRAKGAIMAADVPPVIKRAYRVLRKALVAPSPPDFVLPAKLRRQLHEGTTLLAQLAGISNRETKKKPRGKTRTLAQLLRREALVNRKYGGEPHQRAKRLLGILRRAEALLLRVQHGNPEETLGLRLFWCHLCVELHDVDRFDACDDILGQTEEAAERLGFVQLQMQALDQRAVLRSRKEPPDWKGAVGDSTRAAALAMQLMSVNANGGKGAQRDLLMNLLIVLDRVVELHVQGACRIAQRNPELLQEPLGAVDSLLDAESPRGAFLRYGRIIHTFVEQSQALGLAEARRAFVEGELLPHRFALTTTSEARIVIDSFTNDMRPDVAVVQYFVFGRYILVFVFGAEFFDWHVCLLGEASPARNGNVAHQRLANLFTAKEGETIIQLIAAMGQMRPWIWPEKLDAVLRQHPIRHVCIVPHDILYRLPFGRLETPFGLLLHRYSLSLHPTGQLAAASAKKVRRVLPYPSMLGFIFGPGLKWVEQTRAAVDRAFGRWIPGARIHTVDGAALPPDAVATTLDQFDMVLFVCHGEKGEGHASARLQLGRVAEKNQVVKPAADEVTHMPLRAFLGLSLHRCGLAVFQSCKTGWMDHRREDPVQGFPQAFCDMGAGAVIAPLMKIPDAFAPIFVEILYRTLRFLPAEQALQRTLEVFRGYGDVLCAGNKEAQEMLEMYGNFDVFEYRYTGMTGIVCGNVMTRLVGHLSFWWWERSLRRRRAFRLARRTNPLQIEKGTKTSCSTQ